MQKRFFSIGEALIDFIPNGAGLPLKSVEGFIKKAGGAPANVCAAVARQGVDAAFIGKVGKDAFGDFLIETMKAAGIDTRHVFQTGAANTSLAFVSLKKDGERDFSFYRNPGADMLLEADEISPDWFGRGDFLHFGTVDLIDAPVKQAHIKAIDCVKQKQGTIIFDPNLRLALWDDKQALKETVWAFMPKADILKISDDEIDFIFDTEDVDKAAKKAFALGVSVFLYTMGRDGSRIITRGMDVTKAGFRINAVDATGAGDAFIGAFAAGLIRGELDIAKMTPTDAESLLTRANACGAIVAGRVGAIESMPTEKETEDFIRSAEVDGFLTNSEIL